MPISGESEAFDEATVELHWMKESDRAMAASSGVAVPALCGAWVDPDLALMGRIEKGAPVQYVSCAACDLLADLRTPAMAV